VKVASDAKAASEHVFNQVITSARVKLSKLRASAEEIQRQYEIKVQVVARARAAAALAK
jgi:hypothetical protein